MIPLMAVVNSLARYDLAGPAGRQAVENGRFQASHGFAGAIPRKRMKRADAPVRSSRRTEDGRHLGSGHRR